MLDRAWIASRIPHQGSMCLLETVEAWDAERIRCRAASHRDAANPLRAHGRLGIACGIEYAAQAMAVHGAVQASSDQPQSKAGFLVSVRGVEMHADRLDDIADDLDVEAECVMRNENNILYQFNISAGGRLLLAGRAAVVTNAEGLIPGAQ
ncbi:3-hydroxylacyl-ACP dehydratase [Novimethylophilus kurashikiensis]|uniref:3-hydroxylacyl-ACP dehydratase n=1 Tax=Novimethylophilus kurashikiensis TaxID=1825523 RepID=A0A2R5FEG4_9PROT|nr:3-hydroxylacyl-ACP dehydratase [Novimethylophilus kurashikiensis]GBG15778.1 3-hydroxylacyl-ACP dehydratase [Novimethylophilus kurashikiensis]